ncbi:hypothetical protein [Amycolatopsis thailandensis]|uniref:hypothetical protein n=1 Tax=Amycolatopsis thailandensis TaxID=589330 RepID=UPI00117873D3|nr:hypothetical protein [Amycolatopsis thailandensis]
MRAVPAGANAAGRHHAALDGTRFRPAPVWGPRSAEHARAGHAPMPPAGGAPSGRDVASLRSPAFRDLASARPRQAAPAVAARAPASPAAGHSTGALNRDPAIQACCFPASTTPTAGGIACTPTS